MNTHTHIHAHTHTLSENIIYRIARRLWRIFFPPPTLEQLAELKKKEDYDFLLSCGVETEYGYVTLCGKPQITKHPNARIIIEKGVTMVSSSYYNEAGISHPTILAAMTPGAIIILREGVGVSGVSIVANEYIEIGAQTMVGANANIYDNDFHALDAEERLAGNKGKHSPVIIGEKCWIGANTTILKGVHIGNEAVVGTMSLVNKDIPSKVLAAGVPAKVIRKIN